MLQVMWGDVLAARVSLGTHVVVVLFGEGPQITCFSRTKVPILTDA